MYVLGFRVQASELQGPSRIRKGVISRPAPIGGLMGNMASSSSVYLSP